MKQDLSLRVMDSMMSVNENTALKMFRDIVQKFLIT